MTMSSTDTERRKRAQSESAAATLGESGAASEEWSYKTEQRQSSAFANEGYMRYVSVLTTVEKFSLNFLSLSFSIHVNLRHHQPSLFPFGLFWLLWCLSTLGIIDKEYC